MLENILTRIKEKYSELNNNQLLPSQNKYIIEEREQFFNEYNPDKIANLDGEDLLNCVAFVTGDSKSLGQKLETGLKKEYFGKFSAMQAPVSFMENQWSTGNGRNKEITKEQAISYAQNVKHNIISINQVILDIKNKSENYQKLLDAFDNIDVDLQFARSYFKKYFSVLYPEMFSSLITNNNYEGINTFVGIEDSSNPLVLEKFLFENFPNIKVCDTYFAYWKIFEKCIQIRDNFKKYLKDTVIPQCQSYTSYIETKIFRSSAFEAQIREISDINLYLVNTNKELEELIAILKKSPQWHTYNKNNNNGIPNAILCTHYKNFINNTVSIGIENNNTNDDSDKYPLNQILYGPPGTGKTYNTIIKAMEIIDKNCIKYDNDNAILNYKEIREKFNDAKAKHQIEFVTFHQSYSYEEFVEGIKPDLKADGDIKYILEKGIFKEICENASKKYTDNFDEVYDKFLSEISNCEDDYYKLHTLKNNKVFGLQINSNNNLNIYMSKNFNKQGVITKEKLKKHFENKKFAKDWSNYYDSIIEHLKNKFGLISKKAESKPFVLIIDEINRGNISKIFGELITLIEKDKRENLSVTLPYSKDTFTVPGNLYIIATMNTSDRSIASIDIALRRRFKFQEIMPNKKLVADFGCNFKECFEILNKRISALLDRDHQIGHSYFIEDKYKNSDIKDLERIWFDSIIPLLNEYFYGDWEKLQAILGKATSDNTSFIKILENISFADEYSCDEDDKFDFNPQCDFTIAMKNAFGDKFRS